MSKKKMRYTNTEQLNDEDFRRLTDVKKSTFHVMLDVLIEADRLKMLHGGRKSKLSVADKLLMTLDLL
jgi:hypothetical protein